MKKIIFILLLAITSLSLTSCITEAYATTDTYDDDIEIVVRYGTPYYYDNVLVYYYYNGYYFYPYSYNNTWRFHRYARPLPPPRHHTHPYISRPPKHQPHGYGHHGNGHYGDGHHGNGHYGNGGNHHGGGIGNGNHGNVTRPTTPSRSGGGMSRPSGGHFGGRR